MRHPPFARTLLVTLAIPATLTLQGCQLFMNSHYYKVDNPSPKYADIKSYIIEFNDYGYMRERKQLTRTLAAMDSAAKDHRVLTLLFVHGWKHNARWSDGNLRSFDQMSTGIESALNRNKLPHERPWKVVPVYLGWRGEQVLMRWYTWGYGHVIQQFTFWGRKAAAERVGRGEMAVALSQISSKWRGWRQGDSTTAFNSLIFVGHSFGGAALLSSTLPWVLSTAQNSSDSLAAPADLVIALNPAVQAGILDQTVLSPVLKLATDSARLTKLLVFAATNDFANKWFFPIGRALDSPIGQLGNGRYWRAERQAAGRPSYQLQFLLDPYEGSSSPIILASQDGGNDPALCSRYTTNDDDDDGKFRNLGLTRLNTAVPCRNSVMVVQSRKGVIHSHNGIWSVAARDFIQQFVAEQQRQRERSVTTYLQQKAK